MSFSWKIQGIDFTSNFLVMPLGGCELVLGIQWLMTLGDILWNFKTIKIEFSINGNPYKLQGLTSITIQQVSEETMNQILINSHSQNIAYAIHFQQHPSSHNPSHSTKPNIPEPSPIITQLLDDYFILFKKPIELPPHRSHDHRIPLVEGAKPFNIRPYKHSNA